MLIDDKQLGHGSLRDSEMRWIVMRTWCRRFRGRSELFPLGRKRGSSLLLGILLAILLSPINMR